MTETERLAAGLPSRTGIGFRAAHHRAIVDGRPDVGWLEAHAENYMGGGPAPRALDAVRRDYDVSLHGVGLSLGGAGGLDLAHLERLAALADRIQPFLVSEHLSWSGAGGAYFNDLLPLPYTEEALALVAAHVDQVQMRLGRQILVENPSAYLGYIEAEMDEGEFLTALAGRTGCGLLCDVNNIFVTTRNLGGDPLAWLAALPAGAVGEIHLAGHAVNDADGAKVWIDDHGGPVAEPVWALFKAACRRFPRAPALVEWDSNIPSLDVLVAEAARADRHRAAVNAREAGDAVAA